MQPFCNCLFCQVSPGHVSGFSRLLVAVCRKMWASRNAWGRSGAWVCRLCVGFNWEGSHRHVYASLKLRLLLHLVVVFFSFLFLFLGFVVDEQGQPKPGVTTTTASNEASPTTMTNSRGKGNTCWCAAHLSPSSLFSFFFSRVQVLETHTGTANRTLGTLACVSPPRPLSAVISCQKVGLSSPGPFRSTTSPLKQPSGHALGFLGGLPALFRDALVECGLVDASLLRSYSRSSAGTLGLAFS